MKHGLKSRLLGAGLTFAFFGFMFFPTWMKTL
jgi:hypothetical protein